MPTEPRFILIDTHLKRSIELTTDEVRAAMWRDYLRQPADGAYIGAFPEKRGVAKSARKDKVVL